MELRNYQKAAKAAIYEQWQDKKSTLLVLPTGCGKTVVFGSIAYDRAKDGRVLILAHREELLTQAADKIKKILRDKDGVVSPEDRGLIVKELGDVLWYLASIARYLGAPLSEVASGNIDKLESRWQRNKLHGEGEET